MAEQISIRFGELAAVSDISLILKPASVLGLIGPNGAGKTTLVNCLTGFQAPTEGRIMLDGIPAKPWSAVVARRRGVARTFQGGRLFGAMSVLENVEVAGLSMGLSRNDAREQARELLDWVGYRDDVARRAETIPYVDERRVGIARALIGSPRYVLLDEPAAGMSDAECDQLAELIQQIVSKLGCGVLLIEHNMGLISEVCDWAHVLNSGSTLAAGVPADVLNDAAVVTAYLGEEA